MINVAMLFYSGTSDNFGVGALGVSQVAILREIASEKDIDLHFVVVDGPSNRKPYLFGENLKIAQCRPFRRPLEFFHILLKSDVIFDIGGGDSFSDIYGSRRVFQFLWMKFLALASGSPIVLAPQTFGPFRSRLFSKLALFTIKRCAIVATRDSQSASFLRSIGYSGAIVEASDIALCLPKSDPISLLAEQRLRVGVNVSGLLAKGGYDQRNMFNLKFDYLELIRSIIRDFIDREDVSEIHLIPHVVSSGGNLLEDDFAVCCQIKKEFPNVILAPKFESPSEAKSYISSMDFFIGARMHSCIAAFSSGVPVVPMAYSRKFAGLFGTLGFYETVDCTMEDLEEIRLKISSSFERRDELRIVQNKALEEGLRRVGVYRLALEQLLMSSLFPRKQI